MSRPLKRILLIAGGLAGLLALVALAVQLFVDLDRYKPGFESSATSALGMDVRIGGRLRMGVFPGLHLTVDGGRILDEHAVEVASARRITLWVALLPLFRGESRLDRIELTQPVLSVDRDPEGRLNVERLKTAAALIGALNGARVSISDGTLHYADRRSGEAVEATGLDLVVSHLRFASGRHPQPWKDLSLRAKLACDSIRIHDMVVSDLSVSVHGSDGVLQLEPVTLGLFGGRLTGSIRADLSGPLTSYQVRCSLPRFRIEEFFKTLSPNRAAEGAMDFSAEISMHGQTSGELVRTATGEMSLRGGSLTLVGNDLDRTLSRFESSQSFNLVDVGAVFFAGPMGLAVTKGYGFASLFRGSGGSTRITALVSDWKFERGVARATDVAMATSENRIALQGGLDLVHGRFDDVIVAMVDAKGCAKVRQVIHGSFGDPVVEKPNVLTSLAGPVLKLVRQTRGLLPARPCVAFYSGSVAAPR